MNGEQIVVGITGGIGSGKSFVAKWLREHGFSVFDCDSRAKDIMVSDMRIVDDIVSLLGNEAYICNIGNDGKEEKTLNKQLIADFLFQNSHNAQIINRIVHPRLAEHFIRWASESLGNVVFMESAILFESGFDKLTDFNIFVYADLNLRVKRCVDRDNSTPQLVLKRINMQMKPGDLIDRADFMLVNNDDNELYAQLNEFLKFVYDI